jgi:hypothetical protein
MTDAAAADSLYCANHPQTATNLRCNKCGKPVCAKCIVRTPVGYRCRECMKMQQQVFETAVWYDYVIAGVVAAIAGAVGSPFTGFWFIALFIGPAAGAAAAEIVRWAVRRRRSRALNYVAAGAFVAGCLPFSAFSLIGGSLFGIVLVVVYAALGAGAIYTRLRGISL